MTTLCIVFATFSIIAAAAFLKVPDQPNVFLATICAIFGAWCIVAAVVGKKLTQILDRLGDKRS